MTDQSQPVTYALADGVATITLNRPDAMNSLDVATKVALRDAVTKAADDQAVRCVVLTGSGRAFCVGQDLKEHIEILQSSSSDELFRTVPEHYNPTVKALATMNKPADELLPDPTAALSAYKTRRRTSAYATYTLAEVEAFSVLVDKWLSLAQSAAAIDIGNFVQRNLGRLNINTDLKLQVERWLEDENQRIKVPRVDIQDLRKIINLFYIGFCEYLGPSRADTLLAEAVTRLKSNGGAAFSDVFNKLL